MLDEEHSHLLHSDRHRDGLGKWQTW